MKSTDNWVQQFQLRKSFLESEERYLGDGFLPREAEWFELIENIKYNDGWDTHSIAGFAYQISMDTKQYSRSVYSVLDFFGDVGGLFDMLNLIGQVFISIFSVILGNGLDRFLI